MSQPRVIVCGLGPGGEGDVTAAVADLLTGPAPVYLRTSRHPTAPHGATSFDHLYNEGDDLASVYRTIADEVVEAATTHGTAVYAVPGSPLILERSVRHLLADERIEADLVPAVSFLDAAWARLAIDPVEEGVRLVDGHTFARDAAGERGPMLVAHAHAEWVLSDIKLAIDAGPEMSAIALQGLGTPDERITEVSWPDLDREIEADHLTSLYLPQVTAPVARELQQSVELMHRLRRDCPWDQEQTHQSLRRYLIEEAYEVLEAIDGLPDADGADADDAGERYANLEEELGDLWFQVLFHAELATEAGQFTIGDVARNVHDKLVARHPHVFGNVVADDPAEVVANWEAIKKVEKGRASIMDGIPPALPALALAEKILKKGARAGAPADSADVSAVISAGPEGLDGEGFGRLLLALTEHGRVAGIDPEGALRSAAKQAEDRFRQAEADRVDTSRWIFG